MIVNHVMSNDVYSGIFDAILRYFKIYSGVQNIVTDRPVKKADIYHYHRPNLESKLPDNSVVTVHHDLSDPDGWLGESKFVERYREAGHVICLNQGQKKRLGQLDIHKTTVVPHGYRMDIFEPEVKRCVKNRKLVFGLISKRYGRQVKGEAYLYELVRRINPELVSFILVGEGRSEDAIQLRKLGFEVKVYERLPYRMFSMLYSNLDALLMLSYHEGGPANIPEAIASATPVIGFPVGMVADIVRDGKEGILLSSNVDLDGEMISNILSDPDQISMINREMVRNNSIDRVLTWQESVEMNVAVYHHLLNGKS